MTTSVAKPLMKYVGKRPVHDIDNHCREKLCHLVKDVGCFFEICPEKLYIVYLAKGHEVGPFCDHANDEKCPFIFWTPDDHPSLKYEPFNLDFGPLNLAMTHQFISQIKVWLDTQSYRSNDKHIVIVLDDKDTGQKLNTTLLVAIAAMVLLGVRDEDVITRLGFFIMYCDEPGAPSKKLVFREKKKFADVSGNQSIMSVTLDDCIRSFYLALQFKFYEYYKFDPLEYLFYETVMAGDLNWIIPQKILAFAGPVDSGKRPPSFYYQYFKDHNVTTIIRLNDPEYDRSNFTDNGFDHYDLIFPDGYPPTSPIAAKFIKIVDDAKGAVAVHCYAGIGRTGTLIAAYLMARYNFTAQTATAWTRICRPGSVIGGQQDWLLRNFDQYAVLKSICDTKQPRNRKSKLPVTTDPVIEIPNKPKESDTQTSETTYAEAEKTLGQARALVLAKKHRKLFARGPVTRNASQQLLASQFEGGDSTGVAKAKAAKSDLVLDLGKTIPLMLYLSELVPYKGERNPKLYRLKDNKYDWRVKFPEPGYVGFKHAYEQDLEMLGELKGRVEDIVKEPDLFFTNDMKSFANFTTTSGANKNEETRSSPKHKTTVYYRLVVSIECVAQQLMARLLCH